MLPLCQRLFAQHQQHFGQIISAHYIIRPQSDGPPISILCLTQLAPTNQGIAQLIIDLCILRQCQCPLIMRYCISRTTHAHQQQTHIVMGLGMVSVPFNRLPPIRFRPLIITQQHMCAAQVIARLAVRRIQP